MAQSQYSLQPGTRIGDYEILAELGAGSFGITYKAWDHRLQTYVALKEYLPLEFAVRETDSATVAPRSEKVTHQFQFGLKGFLEEARTLAQFRDARIVRITNFMEANGTAYLVMDYEEGESLDGLLRREQRRLEEPEVLRVMIPVLEGLCIVHRAGVLHRDVKPANIYLRAQGSPLLLDFGAARHALGEETQNLTSIVTPGYGPFEQYQRTGKQGPWTDVYGAGADALPARHRAPSRRGPRPRRRGPRRREGPEPAGPGGRPRGATPSACSRPSTGCSSRSPRTGPSASRTPSSASRRTERADAPRSLGPAHLERLAGARRARGDGAGAGLAAPVGDDSRRRASRCCSRSRGSACSRRAVRATGSPDAGRRAAGSRARRAGGRCRRAAEAARGERGAGRPGGRGRRRARAADRRRSRRRRSRPSPSCVSPRPSRDSAMFHYQQVLSLDPENAGGARGRAEHRAALRVALGFGGRLGQPLPGGDLPRACRVDLAERPRGDRAPAPASPRAARGAPRAGACGAEVAARAASAAPRFTRFSQVKSAYRARQIDGDEYDRLVDELKRRREGELLRAKAAYVSHEISKDQYGETVREIKLRYE